MGLFCTFYLHRNLEDVWTSLVIYSHFITEKKKAFGPPQIIFMYHVQFFGEEAERAWVAENTVIPYEGVDAFHEYCRIMMTQKDKRNKTK